MATVSCMVVLVIGNGLGAVVKGITGFGSAIINLCVWVVCVCMGLDGGTLQQAVVSECVCSEVCALPLLVLTKAGKTCDWRLVCALLISGAVGAPLGAFLLTGLPTRLVEFAMACALLLVICLHCNVGQHITDWLQDRTAGKASWTSKEHHLAGHIPWTAPHSGVSFCQSAGGEVSSPSLPRCLAQQPSSSSAVAQHYVQVTLQQQSSPAVPVDPTADAACPARALQLVQLQACSNLDCQSVAAPAAATPGAALVLSHSTLSADTADGGVVGDDRLLADTGSQPQLTDSSSTSGHSCASIIGKGSVNASDTEQPNQVVCRPLLPVHNQNSCSDQEAAPLLAFQEQADVSANSTSGNASNSNSSSCTSSSSSGCLQQLLAGWAQVIEPGQRQAAMHVFLAGSLAGSVGGVMQGMTGMGGPPLMYMYDKLQVDKDTVRGCNAVLNVLQVRVIAYLLTGVFASEDGWLYGAVSVAGLLGLCFGDRLAGRMNQQVFSKVMVSLMCLCCVLMFASSAGLADQQHE